MATPEYEVDLWASKASAHRARGEEQAATEALARGRALLDAVTSRITDSTLRATFLREIEANARLLALADAPLPGPG